MGYSYKINEVILNINNKYYNEKFTTQVNSEHKNPLIINTFKIKTNYFYH